MKSLACLLAALLPISSPAQDAAPSRELIVAAVGEIPVPKMKVTEVMGRRGYEADESSTKQWFPKEWTVTAGGATTRLQLALNVEPAAMTLPAGATDLALSCGGEGTRSQPVPAATADPGPALMIVFNREPAKPWGEGFATRFTGCAKLDPAAPAATVLNLSGATVMITGRDRKQQPLAPGKSATAPVFVNPQRGLSLLPLSATAGGKSYTLDVTPLDTLAPWCPVVVVYPSTGPAMKERPLKVSVIQPSTAVPAGKAPVATAR